MREGRDKEYNSIRHVEWVRKETPITRRGQVNRTKKKNTTSQTKYHLSFFHHVFHVIALEAGPQHTQGDNLGVLASNKISNVALHLAHPH